MPHSTPSATKYRPICINCRNKVLKGGRSVNISRFQCRGKKKACSGPPWYEVVYQIGSFLVKSSEGGDPQRFAELKLIVTGYGDECLFCRAVGTENFHLVYSSQLKHWKAYVQFTPTERIAIGSSLSKESFSKHIANNSHHFSVYVVEDYQQPTDSELLYRLKLDDPEYLLGKLPILDPHEKQRLEEFDNSQLNAHSLEKDHYAVDLLNAKHLELIEAGIANETEYHDDVDWQQEEDGSIYPSLGRDGLSHKLRPSEAGGYELVSTDEVNLNVMGIMNWVRACPMYDGSLVAGMSGCSTPLCIVAYPGTGTFMHMEQASFGSMNSLWRGLKVWYVGDGLVRWFQELMNLPTFAEAQVKFMEKQTLVFPTWEEVTKHRIEVRTLKP